MVFAVCRFWVLTEKSPEASAASSYYVADTTEHCARHSEVDHFPASRLTHLSVTRIIRLSARYGNAIPGRFLT
jgi:hypothetical protein